MSKVFVLPIAVCLLCLFTFFGTSFVAILLGHVSNTTSTTSALYISDGATFSPESCVFGQFVNMGAVLLGIVIYIRYRQIEELMYDYTNLIKSMTNMNKTAMWFGYLTCLGLSMVANFQITNVPIIHYLGALSCFGSGCVYIWIQGHITYHARAYTASTQMAYLRFGLAALCTYFFFVAILTNCETLRVLFDEQPPKDCKYHQVSVSSEWLVASILCFYVLSFTGEFRQITLNHPKIILVKSENSSITESSQATESVSFSIDIASSFSTNLNGCSYIETHVQLNNASSNQKDSNI
ncbi:DNA damage-regulated autophagy modulator protein 1-like [Contarinia nasturtii]|uniref:DNA damage-regulated autophagy modulator protein 1-like n=1 Tax=Contarinia nasturtii TaxID=265458 RepID=UPI0012D3AA73|nr:DNA damage-regulated autophagy modulator protein 1-like [Contarinia nasturtii]